MPDSYDHWYCNGSVSYDWSRFVWAMNHIDAATGLTAVASSYCGASTDVVYLYGISPSVPYWAWSSAYGLTECEVSKRISGTPACDQFDVWVSDSLIWSYSGGNVDLWDFNMYHIITRETGHTAGLNHDTSGVGAMFPDGPFSYIDWGFTDFTSHDVCHVNAYLWVLPPSYDYAGAASFSAGWCG